jgi:DNA-binding transcriptional MerR regulator
MDQLAGQPSGVVEAAGLTVGDFSRATHLSVKTLHHYHQVGVLEPATVNPDTGYRYYSAGQIATAQVIRRLRDLEMPVADIKAVLAAPDAPARNALIAAHLNRLEAELAQTRTAVESLRNLLQPPDAPAAIEHRSVPAAAAAAIGARQPGPSRISPSRGMATTRHFGHALLVTARGHAGTAVLAVDCRGRVRAITGHAPAVEGGIAVAPASFGRDGGDLVAAGETSGRIFAVAPDGAVITLAASGLPAGGDVGVESTGFVPPGFGARDAAYLADRYSAGNKHPGPTASCACPVRTWSGQASGPVTCWPRPRPAAASS